MSVFGDDSPRSSTNPPCPGEDLYGLSVAELSNRILLYKAEISRLEDELKTKTADNAAAHALFGSPS